MGHRSPPPPILPASRPRCAYCAMLAYSPSFWTSTHLRKRYANASKCNFPHLLEIQINVDGGKRTDPSYPSSDRTPSGASGRGRKRLRTKSKVTIGQGKAAFPPGGAAAAGRAEGTCRGRFLSSFPVPPSRPVPPPPLPAGLRSSLGASVPLPPAPRPLSANLRRSRPRRVQKDARSGARPSPGRPADW